MWAPVGQTPVVRSAGRHVSTNLISAVAVQGAMWLTVYGESLNAARFVGFCRRLLDDVGGSVVLVDEADLQVVRWSPGLAVVVAPVLAAAGAAAGAGGGCGWRVRVAGACCSELPRSDVYRE